MPIARTDTCLGISCARTTNATTATRTPISANAGQTAIGQPAAERRHKIHFVNRRRDTVDRANHGVFWQATRSRWMAALSR